MKSKNLLFVCGAALLCFGKLALAGQGSYDPFVEFQNRFGGNQAFVCVGKGGKKLSVNVSVPQADTDQMKSVPRPEWGEVLSIYLSKGKGAPIDASWGPPKFDQSMKFMSIRLQGGKTLVFERFRDIPDPDADERHFDHKPYFNLTIDGGDKMPCSQVPNLP
ncbi:hypothetical protein [Burkholderia ubonensis]|uniref:Uncharacterized protein n=1 Tax=Burkholderia ubonensis subsp. mesacidophila TaxID=265293 RepID=A0A2A4FB14_9BURK|nr:hypothetical protein [Burkholderia ubonensis]PCE29539.1 hypothetical protein BZL54_25470 [Burkholderia ubonensis subsp. mesacidophila]